MLEHSRLTENTMQLPRFLRGGFFLGAVEGSFNNSRHVDHWKHDCINVLIDKWQEESLQGRETDYVETMAYLRAYEAITKGYVPKSPYYPKNDY